MRLSFPPSLQGTSFSELEKETARGENKLLFISLITSPVCNLACPDCYVGNHSRKKDYLSLDEQKRVLDEAKELGAKTLRIAGEGEPLLDKNFWGLVNYTEKIGLDMFFFTNGTKIKKETAERIGSHSHLTPVVKFSGNPGFMERFTGNKGYFTEESFTENNGLLVPKYLQNLIDVKLNRLDEQNTSRLGIEFLLRKANFGYSFDIFRWARKNNIVPYFEQNLESGSALTWREYHQERVKDIDAYNLSSHLAKIDEQEFGFSWKPSIPYLVGGICESEQSGCKKYTYNIVVSSTGEVNPCYVTYFNLGNVKQTSLKEILNHPIRKELLENPDCNCLCRVYSRTSALRDISSISDLDKTFDYQLSGRGE